MRGKARKAASPIRQARIIPAGAGKREKQGLGRGVREDHPRGCGEKTVPLLRSSSVAGSSPRVRGKGGEGSANPDDFGIIPAGAGKSWTQRT